MDLKLIIALVGIFSMGLLFGNFFAPKPPTKVIYRDVDCSVHSENLAWLQGLGER